MQLTKRYLYLTAGVRRRKFLTIPFIIFKLKTIFSNNNQSYIGCGQRILLLQEKIKAKSWNGFLSLDLSYEIHSGQKYT